jgi:PAS domain S-box-containing protein
MDEGKTNESPSRIIQRLETRCRALEEELERLQESRIKYQRLVENLKDEYFFYTHDTQGVFTYVSPSIRNVLGHPQEDFLTHFTHYLTGHPINQRVMDYTQGSIQGIQQPPYEVEIFHADGSTRRLEVAEVPIIDREGKVVAVEGIAHDITERYRAEEKLRTAQEALETRVRERTAQLILANEQLKREIEERKKAEEALKESEAHYRTLLENLPVGVYRCTPGTEGRFLMANKVFLKMFGFESEEALKSVKVSDLYVDPSQRKGFSEELVAKGSITMTDRRLKKRDGTPIWGTVTARVAPGEGEEAVFDCVIEDITSRKMAEMALLQSEARYRFLVENTFDGFFIAEYPSGRFIFLNQPICDLFGYSPNEGITKSIWDVIDPADHELIKRRLQAKTNGELPVSARHAYTGIRKDGSRIRAEVSASVGEFQRDPVIQGVLRDITAQEQLQRQLQQAQKMEAIGTLAGGIAHDFNNILGAVVGYTELAAMDLIQGSQAHGHLQEVLKACRRARDLVKQILAFSRQSGQERVPLHLGSVVKEALKLLRSSLPTTIEIKVAIEPDLRPVLADGTQIHQVIMNLCTNSAHAMEERGGLLEVDLRNVVLNPVDPDLGLELAPGPYVRLKVSDTGQGIEPDVTERVFDPYFTTKPPGKGTGLGLAVVHGIVKRHGGDIRLRSQLGKGTTVEVFLPIVEAEAINLKEDSEPLPTGKGRVLFVDDELMLATLEAKMLSRLGFEVEAKTDPPEALETFRARPASFDLVITDMTMPNMTGDRLARELLRIRPDVPVILCTGFSERMSEDKAMALGIKGFVMKPVVLKVLAETVQRVLGKDIP